MRFRSSIPRRRRAPTPVALMALLVLALVPPVVWSAAASAETWIEPVDAPIVDPFRPPTSRYGAGNRGLEYGAAPGSAVVAVDDGIVTYSGRIGASRYLVVTHGSGLRSTYAYITESLVVRGQRVSRGQTIARAGPGFHLTARLGDEYVDPMLLFGGAEVVIHLVSGVDPPSARGLSDGRWDWARSVGESAGELTPSSMARETARAAAAWFHSDCSPDGVATAGGGAGRVAIQVAGLGSSSAEASVGGLDLGALGYAADDVVAFSYGGGCGPAPFGGDPVGDGWLGHDLPRSSYGPTDTYDDLHASAAELADLIEAVAAERPGAVIDVVAHSLGGVVTRLAIEMLAERYPRGLPVGVVITIGSPHQGTDLATAGTVARGSEGLAEAVAGAMPVGQFDADSVKQVSEAGRNSLDPPGPPPDGVTVIAVAGASDPIVTAESAIWYGATNALVDTGVAGSPTAHSDLPGRPEVARELALALAGLPPRCVGLAELVRGTATAGAVEAGENLVGVLAGISHWVL